MASKSRINWTTKDLQAALTAIKNDKISLRAAEGAFGVPKNTLSFYLRGKAEVGAKPGPLSVLTAMEEAKLGVLACPRGKNPYSRTYPEQ